MGTKTRRWRRSAFAGRFAARHKGSLEKNAQGRSQPIQALSPAHRSVMERSPVAFDQNFSGAAADFLALLRSKGLRAQAVVSPVPQRGPPQTTSQPSGATTRLA